MKIIHITSVHPQNDNRILYKECSILAENNYDVTLVVAGAKNETINNVKIIGYEKSNGGRIKRILKTSFWDMLKKCNELHGDIYHFHDPELIFVGLYLKAKGKKVIYDIHENNPAAILSKPYLKSSIIKILLSKVFHLFEQISSVFFDALVTARPDITDNFKHKKIITLRNFPVLSDLSKYKKIDINKTKPSVIYVGGMTKLRGINQLLDAFEELDAYELWLLGPIGERELQERIENGCKNVIYFGIVEAYEVFPYIDKADMGVITFLEAPNHVNTLATKPFEYMACGKPMIMSHFLYWKETFQDSSLYVNPLNSHEIADKVKELFSNDKLMKMMGEKNSKLSQEKFNWQKESIKMLNLYRDLEE